MDSNIDTTRSKMTNGIDRLIELNRVHSTLFSDPGNSLSRRRYRGEHPTEITFLKCMDGRLNGSIITETPLGIIQPFRNIGGKFNLGWSHFGDEISGWIKYSTQRGRNCLIFVTYHFSEGDKHRGCRGFDYDRESAMDFARKLKGDFDNDFGKGAVYTIQAGIETDFDAIILHGENGEIWDLAKEVNSSEIYLISKLRQFYPKMPERTILDFLPLIQGNIRHVAKIKSENRPIIDAKHREWVIGIGRGFDWFHLINAALIVGPFDPDLDTAIETAARLVKNNLDEERIPREGKIVLLTSKSYREEAGPEKLQAARKSRFLMDFAFETIKNRVPEILDNLECLAVTVNTNTRLFDMIERSK
jgi:hypothetical protein